MLETGDGVSHNIDQSRQIPMGLARVISWVTVKVVKTLGCIVAS